MPFKRKTRSNDERETKRVKVEEEEDEVVVEAGEVVDSDSDSDSEHDDPDGENTVPLANADIDAVTPESKLDETQASKLKFLLNRVLVKPKLPKNKRVQRASRSGVKRAKPKPTWLYKEADLEEMLSVIFTDEETDQVYIDISAEAAPYNVYTTKIIRHFARKAKKYPSMCLEWNCIVFKHQDKDGNDQMIPIPLGGRTARRSTQAALTRTHLAFDGLRKLGIVSQPTVSMLKDFGYGSTKATVLKDSWKQQAEIAADGEVAMAEEKTVG